MVETHTLSEILRRNSYLSEEGRKKGELEVVHGASKFRKRRAQVHVTIVH